MSDSVTRAGDTRSGSRTDAPSAQEWLGTPGDIVLGDDTERNVYPHTDLCENLGTSVKRFKDIYAAAAMLRAGTGTAVAHVGGVIDVNTTAVGNVGAGTDDLITYTMPAHTLASDGDSIEVVCGGYFAANANLKRLNFVFGGTNLFTSILGTDNAGEWRIAATVIRTGSSAQESVIGFTCSGTTITTEAEESTSAIDTTAAIIVKCTGQGVANDDVYQTLMRTIYWPAP